jgi:hypothetical protein
MGRGTGRRLVEGLCGLSGPSTALRAVHVQVGACPARAFGSRGEPNLLIPIAFGDRED